jgi:dolichol-phosphate mannosyltransferase
VPFFNEAANAAPLLAELERAATGLGCEYELVLIDDGSTDETAGVLDEYTRGSGAAARVIRFSNNLGQAAALWTGFQTARGEWIATLDGDGQNPPEELAKLWAARLEADMITGRRVGRKDSRLRIVMSHVANAVRRRLLRDGVHDSGCALKLFRREVVGSFLPMRTLYSFLPAFARAGGWRVKEIAVAHRPRVAGTSKYGLRVMAWRPLLDLFALSVLLRRVLNQKRAADVAVARVALAQDGVSASAAPNCGKTVEEPAGDSKYSGT